MDVQHPSDAVEGQKKGKQTGFASAFSFWKQQDDHVQKKSSKSSGKISTSAKSSSGAERRGNTSSGNLKASENSLSSRSERSEGLAISSSLDDSSTASSAAAHSHEGTSAPISDTSALRAASARHYNASHAMTAASDASESESYEGPPLSPSSATYPSSRRGNLAEDSSDSKSTTINRDRSTTEGTIAVEPLIPHTSKYWSPSRSRPQSSTPRLGELPAHMIRSEPVIIVPKELTEAKGKENSPSGVAPTSDGLVREGSSDSVSSSKSSRLAQSAAPSVMAATLSPRRGESPLDRLIISSTSKLRLSNDSVPSAGARPSGPATASNPGSKPNSSDKPSSSSATAPPRISEPATKHASQISIGGTSQASGASGASANTAYSGAGSDDPSLVEQPRNGNRANRASKNMEPQYGHSSAGSRSTMTSDEEDSSASPNDTDIYYRRNAKGNTSSPGVIVTATTATVSPPAAGGPTLSIPGSIRMLNAMGGSAGALVGRSRDSGFPQRQSPGSPVQDLWSLSEQILLELSSNSSTASRHSPGSSPSGLGASSAVTSARSTEAEDGSSVTSPLGSLDAGSSMSTSSFASSVVTSHASSTITTASREETDDSATEPSDMTFHSTSHTSSPQSGVSTTTSANSSTEKSKNIKLSRKTTPPTEPQSARSGRGVISDLASTGTGASGGGNDAVSSMQSAPAGMHQHRRSRSRDKKDSKRRLVDPGLHTTPEEVEPVSPTSASKPPVIPLDMRYMSNPNSARSSASALDSPSSSDGSAHFPRRDKGSSRSLAATPSSPGGSRLRVVRQFSSEMLDSHTVSHTDPEPHRFGPRTTSSSALSNSANATSTSSSNNGGQHPGSASTTSGSGAGHSSSDDLSSSSSDAGGSPAAIPKKKSFFSSLFSSRKRRTLQLTSVPGRDFSSADSADRLNSPAGSPHNSPHMSPVYSKKTRGRRNSSDFGSIEIEDLAASSGSANNVRPRGYSVAEVQHSRHMTSDLDDFTASPVRRDSVRSVRSAAGLTDLLSPRPGEQITYRPSSKGLSMPSSPYESDDDPSMSTDGIGRARGTSSAKSTSEFIGYHSSHYGGDGKDSEESTPEKGAHGSPAIRRRNSLDPSAAKMAFRMRSTGNSSGSVAEESLTQSTLSPNTSSRGGPGGTLKDSKKKDKKSREDALSASMSPPSPRKLLTIFGIALDVTPGRLGHFHSQSLGGGHSSLASPTSPSMSASPSTSSLVITPRTPDGLPPLSPRQDCPELLTTACHALLTLARESPDRVDFSDTFSTTATFSAKDKKHLRLAIEDGSMDLGTETDPKMIAQAILTFLEDLPDALCTYRLFGDFLILLQMEEEKHRLMALHSLVWSLPRAHRATFILIIDFILSMANSAMGHDHDPEKIDEDIDARRDHLVEFFAPAIFRARSYSTIHTSPRPYMLGELKGTNLSSAFSSAHGNHFTTAVHGHSTGPVPNSASTSSNIMRSPSGTNMHGTNAISSRTAGDYHFDVTPLTPPGNAMPLSAPGNNRSSVNASLSHAPADNSTIGPFMVPRSPRSPPLHFGDPTPLSASHTTAVPQPTTFNHSSASSTGPLHPGSGRQRHGHSASVSGPSGPTVPKTAVIIPPLQLPSGGSGIKRSKSNGIYESSEEGLANSKYANKNVPVSHIGGNSSSHGAHATPSSKQYPFPRAQSSFSPATSPPNSPTSQTLSARSLFQASSLLRLAVVEHETVCGLSGADWMFEVLPGPMAACVVESGTIDFLFDLLGNQFYRDHDFADAFLLGVGELLSPQEILAKIISRVRSGDASKPWVRMRGAQLLRHLAAWIHTLAHLLAPIRPFFHDLEALIHSSIDEEETQMLSNFLAELTIAAASLPPQANGAAGNASSSTGTNAPTLKRSVKSSSVANASHTLAPTIDVSPVTVILDPITDTTSPDILAQHLTIIDAEYLKALKPRCSLTDTIGGFLNSAPFVDMSDRFNTVSLWVQNEVVSGPSTKERATRVVYFANVASALVSMNNFNGALAVFTGLCSVNVTRMIKVMTSARKRAGKVLDQLETLFSMTKNSKNYTDRLRASSLPIIPQIVLYARNLFSLDENNVAFEDSSLGKVMNMTKFRDFLKQANELAKYQRSTYYFPRDNALYGYLSAIDPPSDDHIYALSLRAEAKKKDRG